MKSNASTRPLSRAGAPADGGASGGGARGTGVAGAPGAFGPAARRRPGRLALWVALGDVAIVHAGFLAAFLLRFHGSLPAFNFRAYLLAAPGLTILAVALFLVYGLYDFRSRSAREASAGVAAAATLFLAFGMALSFFVRALSLPRSVFWLAWVVHVMALPAWRGLVWRLALRAWGTETAFVVGPDGEAQAFAGRLGSGPHPSYVVQGVVLARAAEDRSPARNETAAAEVRAPGSEAGAADTRSPGARAAAAGWPVFPAGSLRSLLAGGEFPVPDAVVLTPSVAAEDKAEVVTAASEAGVRVLLIPGHRELLVLDSGMAQLDDTLAFDVGPTGVPAHLGWAKRLTDVGVAAAGLALTLPFYPFIALAVKLSSPGPVFYLQPRVGQRGRIYNLAKFRTMRRDAEALTGPVLSRRADPRVTGVGRFLRRFRLDELPQLVNVLVGSMSLVGPRPERPEFVREYSRTIPCYGYRHLLKPGLTGLAQLYARYNTPADEKLRYDLLYAKRYSLLLDFRILLLTAKVVLTGEEAHWENAG